MKGQSRRLAGWPLSREALLSQPEWLAERGAPPAPQEAFAALLASVLAHSARASPSLSQLPALGPSGSPARPLLVAPRPSVDTLCLRLRGACASGFRLISGQDFRLRAVRPAPSGELVVWVFPCLRVFTHVSLTLARGERMLLIFVFCVFSSETLSPLDSDFGLCFLEGDVCGGGRRGLKNSGGRSGFRKWGGVLREGLCADVLHL